MTGRNIALPAAIAFSLALAACKPASDAAAPSDPAPAPAASPGPTAASSAASGPAAASAPITSGFRALGNEPGWMVQVTGGDTPALHAELDYGERQFDIAPVERIPGGWKGKAPDGTAVVLKVERRECQDTMAGQKFEATAKLVVGDRDYDGCGTFDRR